MCVQPHIQKYISRIIWYRLCVPVCTSACLIKAHDFELGSICPHENSLNPVLPSLGACSCNTEAPLIRIRDISYDQRNSISRTSPRRTKWSFANPPQLLIAATNITGHKWLHPQTQIWLIKHRLRLSVLFTLVYHSGINTHLWKCDLSTVMHFIMIYARTIHGKCGSRSRINPQSNVVFFKPAFYFSCVWNTDWEISLVNVHIQTRRWSHKASVFIFRKHQRGLHYSMMVPPLQINYKVWSK